MGAMITVREERSEDVPAVRAIHRAAFPGDAEARIVDLLRARGKALISLVAGTPDGATVGHILFSPVTLDAPARRLEGAGLAPLAVLPSHQGRGIGSELVRMGLAACRTRSIPFIVVLGDPRYYGRFGFGTASAHNLASEYGAGPEFMVQDLIPGSLPTAGGLVRYAPEFAELGV